MDYLRGHALASVPALLVVVRLLSSGGSESSPEPILQRRLQPLSPGSASGREQADEARGVLAASLEVGLDLGLLRREGDRRSGRRWALTEAVPAELTSTDAFRSHVLMRLGARALAAMEEGERPSDLVRALTWLMQQDPRMPLATTWAEGPEEAFDQAGLHDAVDTPEQYLALRRWVRALGLGALTRVETDSRARLTPDPTPAITMALPDLPPRADAEAWLTTLLRRLPMLGSPSLLAALPEGAVTGEGVVSPPTALALVKLETAQRLTLEPSDDATRSVTIALPTPRRIGHISRMPE